MKDELYGPCIYMTFPNTCSLCPDDGGDPEWHGSENGTCMVPESIGEAKDVCKLYVESILK